MLFRSIEDGLRAYSTTKQLILPPLINSPEQVFSFFIPKSEPNYITVKTVKGHTSKTTDTKNKLRNSILLISSADPGYDWIFSHKIAGFITMYGGMNSHMAIRALELGIPAVIGAGEVLYGRWEKAKFLELDCINRKVRIIK